MDRIDILNGKQITLACAEEDGIYLYFDDGTYAVIRNSNEAAPKVELFEQQALFDF